MCLCHRRKYIDASNVGVVGGVIGDAAPSFNSIVGRLCLRCGFDRIRKWDLQTCPITFNPVVVKLTPAEIDVMSISCLRNMSLLAVLKKVNVEVAYVDNLRKWIDSKMMPLQRGTETSISQSVKSMLSDNEAFKEYLMQFTKEADFNISDIKVKKMAALFGHTVETNRGMEHYVSSIHRAYMNGQFGALPNVIM